MTDRVRPWLRAKDAPRPRGGGSVSGNTERTGTATGQMPPEPESSVWLEKVKSYGPAGLALVDFFLRVYQTFK
jgi:hypothetical protein